MSYHKPKQPGFHPPIRGRGAGVNPSGRFETQERETDEETFEALREVEAAQTDKQVKTEIYTDATKTIITRNKSPDIHMSTTINPYRGCEHGCIYCYARPTHEYLGHSAGVDFESKIYVKDKAPELLKAKLSSRSWTSEVVAFSGITDPYQPLEKQKRLTRDCLKVLRDFKNPAVIITKNHLVTRDIDILADMARDNTISVKMSVTTLDGRLCRLMEPRTSQPKRRLQAIEALANAGVPVGIMIGPVLPGLTEHEIPAIMKAASEAGAMTAHYTMLRLPYGVKDLFEDWLRRHYPDRADKVLNHLRAMHGGKLYDSRFGSRMRGQGVHADHVAHVFAMFKKRYGLTQKVRLSTDGFDRDAGNGQLSLL